MVVKKKKVVKKAPERIQNIDLVKYFKTGEEELIGDNVFIEGNTLKCITRNKNSTSIDYSTPVAIKIDEYTIINGDNISDSIGDFYEAVEDMQDSWDSKQITTSFVCLENAGINIQKMKVLEITEDMDVISEFGEKDFDDFEFHVPQGATYREYRNFDKCNKITEKRYHRAGCMLIRSGKHSYLCGMDEESYFVTKLLKNSTTIEKAFKSLKPKAVQQWEEKNKTKAKRQGEWFFLPTTLEKVKGMRRKGLPLWKDGGNKHIADYYAIQDGRHYVKGNINHVDHKTIHFDNTIHEAHRNTALGSWSEQGVD